ncbi:DJ-1 family glyoxalase III [Halanaerobaculum tunisiense]
MSKVIILLADGCEEIEAITNIDVLRRASVEVETVALDKLEVTGDHGITITADKNIDQVDLNQVTGIILPGGMPGAANLRDDQRVINIVRKLDRNNDLIAAICAAPIVLEEAGILKDRSVTSYPSFASNLPSCDYQVDRVVTADNLITGRGPGVALEFALEVVKYLVREEKVKKLKSNMLTNF